MYDVCLIRSFVCKIDSIVLTSEKDSVYEHWKSIVFSDNGTIASCRCGNSETHQHPIWNRIEIWNRINLYVQSESIEIFRDSKFLFIGLEYIVQDISIKLAFLAIFTRLFFSKNVTIPVHCYSHVISLFGKVGFWKRCNHNIEVNVESSSWMRTNMNKWHKIGCCWFVRATNQ